MAVLTGEPAAFLSGPDPLLEPAGADGIYGRSGAFEGVVDALGRALSAMRPDGAEVRNFPPVMSRAHLEQCGYLAAFPHLAAGVCTVEPAGAKGSAYEAGARPTDLVLTPAACYPLYPLTASRGAVGAAGACYDTFCNCFRREPSKSVDRLQSFRMREFVFIGTPGASLAFRDRWIPKIEAFAHSLGLETRIAPAQDPFFGRMGAYLAQNQIDQGLKFELLCPVVADEPGTAVFSFNYHQDHFGHAWGIRTADGALAHSSCVAVGVDRLALAMCRAHGAHPERWPASLRALLGADLAVQAS